MDEHSEWVPWMRLLGRRFSSIGEERVELWQRRAESLWRGIVMVGFVAGLLFLGYVVTYIVNWSPLWMRAYTACKKRLPESDTVVEMFRRNQKCVEFATRIVGERSK